MADQGMLQAALAYAALGWYVFPLRPRGKQPLIPKAEGGQGLLDATTDEEQIRAWWTEAPTANIGVACGPSNLVVIDLDVDKGGIQAWKRVCDHHDLDLATKVMVRTGGGGIHLFYRMADVRIRNSAGKLDRGIDIRGDGGYVVAPPSIHPSGHAYAWRAGGNPAENEVQQVPTPLIDALEATATLETIGGDAMERADELADTVPEGERNTVLTSLAGTMRRRGMSTEAILAALGVENEARCVPPLTAAELQTIAESVASYTPLVTIHLSDLGNARLFVQRHGDNLRYLPAWKEWLTWDGCVWRRDTRLRRMAWAKETVLSMYALLASITDKTTRKAVVRWVTQSESAYRLRSLLEVARSEEGVTAEPSDFDTNPWLLTVENGTLDLRTGELQAHRRDDMITKLAPTTYEADAACPKWLALLDLILEGNAELITYLQRVLGYALTADTREQVFFILHGEGANGKTTFIETMAGLMGAYAQAVPTSTLVLKRAGTGDPPRGDLARLFGVRLATATETEAGRRLAEALVKQMTGGDRVVARYPYGRHFEFTPSHKTFLATNHRPEIRGTDWAIWRRIHLIPFNVRIPEERQIKDYHRFLVEEWPGILAWAVRGCLAWQEQGLVMPSTVRAATLEFREEMNPISPFIEERCAEGDDKEVKGADLWQSYTDWCEDSHERRLSRNQFSQRMAEAGFPPEKRRDGAWHHGLCLRGDTFRQNAERIAGTIGGPQ